MFAEWRDDPAHYADGKWTHVIEPFDIPDTWRVYRSFDFGYAKPFSVGWWAVDFDGRLYRILELYGCVPGEPDTGVRWTPEQIFTQIRATETTHPYLRGRDIRGVADPAIWDASRGDSIADIADRYGGIRGARCRCCATTRTRPRTSTHGRRTTSPTRSGICASPIPLRRARRCSGRRKCSTL